MHIAGLVPMRKGSQRVSDKNRRSLGDRPLYHHIIETLQAASSVDEVVIDTDDEIILAEAERVFPEVSLLRRPPTLATDDVQMNDVLLNLVPQVDADLYVQTHSTTPLILPETVDRAIGALKSERAEHDSLFSVTPTYLRFWAADGTPVNHDPSELVRTQDLQPLLEENSCMYVFDRKTLEERQNRVGEKPLLFPMDPTEAWDIDNEPDLVVAEALYRARGRSGDNLSA